MLLIDLSSIVVTSTIELLAQDKSEAVTSNLIRHITLSQILYYKSKFKTYGKPILCADSKAYWRKDVFEHYKQNRKKAKSKSPVDWKDFYRIFNEIKIELVENFPFNFLEVNKLEADDLIFVLAGDTDENVMIVSSDKDMLQLQDIHGTRIKQYSPAVKKQLTLKNKEYCLLTHIIKGDISDGIPNILSDDDTFMDDDKRQKAVYKTFIDKVKDANNPFSVITDKVQQKRFKRNRLLIDATYLPNLVLCWIHKAWEKEQTRMKKAHMYQYMVDHDMKLMLTRLQEFTQ